MRLLLNKDFLVYSLAVFLVFGTLSLKMQNSEPELASILSAVETENTNPIPDDIQEIKPSQQILLTGRLISKMTYGRILLKNLTASTSFSYFIAEPNDVDENDPNRESQFTKNTKRGATLEIDGKLSAKCYWNDSKYGGCVPWVEITTLATKSF